MTIHTDIGRGTSGHAAGICFLRRHGRGDTLPLVLLHGIGSHARSFEAVMAALPDSLDIIAWNAPGYGMSQALPGAAPAPRDYAKALLQCLDALGLTRVVLTGHSLGCLFAASFAAMYPARVAALALVSPALGYRVAPGADLPPAVQARIDEIESLGPNAFASKRAGRLLHRPECKPQLLAAVREAMAAVSPAGYAQAVRALGAGDLLTDAASVEAQTLVAVGAEDVVTPPVNAQAVYAVLNHPAGYHAIADAGHALPQENPTAVARLLMQLIERKND